MRDFPGAAQSFDVKRAARLQRAALYLFPTRQPKAPKPSEEIPSYMSSHPHASAKCAARDHACLTDVALIAPRAAYLDAIRLTIGSPTFDVVEEFNLVAQGMRQLLLLSREGRIDA